MNIYIYICIYLYTRFKILAFKKLKIYFAIRARDGPIQLFFFFFLLFLVSHIFYNLSLGKSVPLFNRFISVQILRASSLSFTFSLLKPPPTPHSFEPPPLPLKYIFI